ncbi:MAG: hypothetical protein AB8B99_18060 [Phormidesmis sp.]
MTEEQSRGRLDLKRSWFVPWAELSELDNHEKHEFGYLRKTDSELKADDQFVEEGDPFTISLESFLIREGHDKDNTNDLLVRSFVRYGNEPKTETIHFFGTDIEAGTFQEDLESEHVFAREDFLAAARIWMSFEIIEIDRGLDEDRSIGSALNQMRGRFGAIFPALIPFSTVAGVAAGMIDKLKNFQRATAKNEPVFQNTLDLYSHTLAGGDGVLRYGAYILFKEDVQGIQYQLGSGYKLKRRAAADKNTPVLHDYVVMKITPGIVQSGQDAKELLKNQQVATVVSELNENESDAERKALHFSFLEDMVESANQFKELKEYRRLMAKKKIGEELTQAQKTKLIGIVERLGQFLPD